MVAIKTLAWTERFGSDELAESRVRFFHEAGTAQRLSHPDIVAAHAAGEDRDVAYIAMERLKGKDLASCVGQRERLPLVPSLSMCARVAEALCSCLETLRVSLDSERDRSVLAA